MDEEYNHRELEERLYAMIHHVDGSQVNVDSVAKDIGEKLLNSAPRSTVRRYWKSGSNQNSVYQKVNKPKEPNKPSIGTMKESNNNSQKPKEEKCNSPDTSDDHLLLFQQPPQNFVRTIEILDHEIENTVIESSDDDEVVEVKIPPKPTITIASSDEDEICIITEESNMIAKTNKPKKAKKNVASNRGREVSASPVPSAVSSVSDDFIRNDCIALNISSSKKPGNHKFDFSLHGSDLLEHETPSKKMKKKKKAKEPLPSIPVASPVKLPNNSADNCFATPKSKSKKKQKNKSYVVFEKCVPNADVYDSDSNQSTIEFNAEQKAVSEVEKTPPKTDGNADHAVKENSKIVLPKEPIVQHAKGMTKDKTEPMPTKTINLDEKDEVVDLTNDNENNTPTIKESIVMANVTGLKEPDSISTSKPSKHGSTNVPEILNEHLDFDHLKGTIGHRSREYSEEKLRSDMDDFYNDSWGGEDFSHWELMKSMPRDAELWEIDPRDKNVIPIVRKKMICSYCNRTGHRYDTCWSKPKVCHMCGTPGHTDARCPNSMCLNCGTPNRMYTNVCRNCAGWEKVTCDVCRRRGHPGTHCSDNWRRYHNTTEDGPVVENHHRKKPSELYCSGCAGRGHYVKDCRSVIPFSGLYIPYPYVVNYAPVIPPLNPQYPQFHRNPQYPQYPYYPRPVMRKRHSPGPRVEQYNKTFNAPAPGDAQHQRRQRDNSQRYEEPADATPSPPPPADTAERDRQGRVIQDSEVSDTSAVDTTARVLVAADVTAQLRTAAGADWLEAATARCGVIVHFDRDFLSVRGKVADQEDFYQMLRDWRLEAAKKKEELAEQSEKVERKSHDYYRILCEWRLEAAKEKEKLTEQSKKVERKSHDHHGIPKKKDIAYRHLKTALDSLDEDFGDPGALCEELEMLQSRRASLRGMAVVNKQQLKLTTDRIKFVARKLNMIFLGKAGLAEGQLHVVWLYELLQQISKIEKNNLSVNLRNTIGMHFHSVFSNIPRDDYPELLKMYEASKKNEKSKNKKKRKDAVAGAAPPRADPEDANVCSSPKKSRDGLASVPPAEVQDVSASIELLKSCLNKIVKCRPKGKAMKVTRDVLQAKLKKQINFLHAGTELTPKVMSKSRKVYEKVQTFLDAVC